MDKRVLAHENPALLGRGNSLNETQRLLIEFLKLNPAASQIEMADHISKSRTTVKRLFERADAGGACYERGEWV